MAMPRKQKMPYSIHEKGTSRPSSNSPPSKAESSSEALSRSSSSASDRYSNLDAMFAFAFALIGRRSARMGVVPCDIEITSLWSFESISEPLHALVSLPLRQSYSNG